MDMEWISIKEKIPTGLFRWKDDISLQSGIGDFDKDGKVSLVSSGGYRPWFFKDWSSITHWMPLPNAAKKVLK